MYSISSTKSCGRSYIYASESESVAMTYFQKGDIYDVDDGILTDTWMYSPAKLLGVKFGCQHVRSESFVDDLHNILHHELFARVADDICACAGLDSIRRYSIE